MNENRNVSDIWRQRALIGLFVAIIATCDFATPKVLAISVLYIIPIVLTVAQRSVRCTLAVTLVCIGLDAMVYTLGHGHKTITNSINQGIGLVTESLVGLITALFVRFATTDDFAQRRAQTMALLAEQVRNAASVDDVYDLAVKSVASLLSVDRVYVLPLSDELAEGAMLINHEWHRPEVSSMRGVVLPAPAPNSLRNLKWTDRTVLIPDTSLDDRVSQTIRETYSVRASALSRIYIQGRSVGLLIIHDCRKPRNWSADEVSVLEEIAAQVSTAAEEARLNQRIAEQAATIDFVFEYAPIGIVVVDTTRRIKRSNQYYSMLMHKAPDDLVGKTLADIHPEMLSTQDRIFDLVFAGQTILNREIRLPIKGSAEKLNDFRFSYFPIAHAEGTIDEIGILIEDITEERAAQRDITLALARERRVNDTLQRTLLPALPPRLSAVNIGYVYRPASADRGIGGDFLDIVPLEGGKVAMFIGDVTGHGVEAAAQTSLIKNVLRAYALLGDPPGATVTRLNEALINQFHFENLVTLFYGVLDTVSGRLEYASAGHEPPIIIRNADRKLDRIEPTGTVVGLDIGIEFGDAICQMAVNDVLVLLTDGFVEARSRWAAGILGEARLHEGLLKSIADSEDLQAGADSMWEYVVDAMGTGDLEDDAALLLVARCLERGSKGGLAYSTLRQPMKRPASYRATGGKSFRLAG